MVLSQAGEILINLTVFFGHRGYIARGFEYRFSSGVMLALI